MHRNELPKEGQHPLVKANHMSVNGENMVMQRCPTVDGKKKEVGSLSPWFTGFCTFQVVQDFSHQQYVVILCLQMELSESNGDTPKALFNKINGFFTHFP